MPRKSDTATTPAAPRSTGSLRDLRSRIDKLDLQILELDQQAGQPSRPRSAGSRTTRATRSSRRPGKKKSCKTSCRSTRRPRGRCSPETVRAIFREIMSGSRALQKVLKVAYLGPEYSFSHLAAVERFGQAVEFIGVGSIAAVFEEVNRGHADFGVVPLENSTDGRVADTLDMFIRMPQPGHLGRGAAAHPPQPAGQLRAAGNPPGLQQAAGAVAVPQLAEQERAARHACARCPAPPIAAELAKQRAGCRRGRQPAGRRPLRPAHPRSRTSRIRRTTRRASPSSATRSAAKTGHDKTAMMFQRAAPARLAGRRAGHLQAEQDQPDLDRVVPRPRRPSRNISSSSISRATSRTPRSRKALKALEEHCDEVTVLGSFPMAMTAG